MSWVDQQLKQRAKADRDQFQQAFEGMASIVMGKIGKDHARSLEAKNAIAEIFKYFAISPEEVPEEIVDLNDQLDFLLRPTGIMRRTVHLDKGWYKDAIGPMLGQTKEGNVLALIPGKLGGYNYFDNRMGKWTRITNKNAGLLAKEAICFYKPLPLKKLGIKDLGIFIAQTLNVSDLVMIVLATFAITLIGMVVPYTNKIIFSEILESGVPRLLMFAAGLLIGTTLARMLMEITKSLIMSRIETKMSLAVEAAAMMRVLSLPARFFRDYSSGELSARVQTINSLCSMLVDAILTVGLSSLFSFAYLIQVFNYAPALVVPALTITLLTFVVSVTTAFYQMKISKMRMETSAREGGLIYSLFSSVQKIKLAGAEQRSFARWAAAYESFAKLNYNPPLFLKINSVITLAISLLGTIYLYYSAVISGVGVGDYMAFTTAYGMISAAFMSLASVTSTFARIKPTFEMAEPILRTVPEIEKGKRVISKISGNVEINNISFRYTKDMPYVLDDLSLKIRPGQYVAIVGSTGCGKSTLIRLLLGFEKPEKGAIYYDGHDLSSVDIISLRKNLGCVVQNGKLFSGSIYSNIVVSAPWLSLEDAWQAAELAQVADDIRDMPMGMHTIISEGGGGISGGQKQRLMIARAIAPKPKLLILDEATSALDNITQKRVSETLETLKCTRIVIAHRLSTIKQCDRIIVLDGGKIVEDGNYDDLIAKNGIFAELVEKQQVRIDE